MGWLAFFSIVIGCISLVVSVRLIMEGRRSQFEAILKRVDKFIDRMDHWAQTGD